MVRRPGFFCGVLLVLLLSHAAAAYGAAGDPEAGSPSGGVYELPLEKGRADAAPGGSGGTTAPEEGGGDAEGGTGGGEGESGEAGSGGEGEEPGTSYYRSENNFGSSSHVPGTDGGAGDAGAAGGAGGGSGGSGSAGGGDDGAGAGAGTDVDQVAAEVPDTGNTSVAGNVALLAALGVLAALVGGYFARRRLRTR